MIRSARSMAGATAGVIGGQDPAAGGAQRGGPARMRPGAGRDRGDGGAAAGQPGARVEGVAAVVAAPGQHHDPGAVHLAGLPGQQGGAHRRRARRRPAPSACPSGSERHQRAFGGADRGDLVGVSHGVISQARACRTSSASLADDAFGQARVLRLDHDPDRRARCRSAAAARARAAELGSGPARPRRRPPARAGDASAAAR